VKPKRFILVTVSDLGEKFQFLFRIQVRIRIRIQTLKAHFFNKKFFLTKSFLVNVRCSIVTQKVVTSFFGFFTFFYFMADPDTKPDPEGIFFRFRRGKSSGTCGSGSSTPHKK
jgi:hypothetical protein